MPPNTTDTLEADANAVAHGVFVDQTPPGKQTTFER